MDVSDSAIKSQGLTASQVQFRNFVKENRCPIIAVSAGAVLGAALGYVVGDKPGAMVGGLIGAGTGLAIGQLLDNLSVEVDRFNEAASLSGDIVQERQRDLPSTDNHLSTSDGNSQIVTIAEDRRLVEEIIEQNTKTLALINGKIQEEGITGEERSELLLIRDRAERSLADLNAVESEMSALLAT